MFQRTTKKTEEKEITPTKKQLASLAGGAMDLVMDDKGQIIVEKPEWSAQHVEVVDSLDVENEETAQSRTMLQSTLDFFGGPRTTDD